jgi:hypothetical protein
MKVNQIPQKTNPQIKTNLNQGMDVFLTPSSNPTQNDQKTNPKNQEPKNHLNENKAGMDMFMSQPQSKVEERKSEIEAQLEELEKKLRTKTLDFSAFNKIAFEKKLVFKLLFIRDKIYLKVRDQKGEKNATIALELPRWGGTSIRYLINNCLANECIVVEKDTSKGKILTYFPISGKSSPNISDIDDIFD